MATKMLVFLRKWHMVVLGFFAFLAAFWSVLDNSKNRYECNCQAFIKEPVCECQRDLKVDTFWKSWAGIVPFPPSHVLLGGCESRAHVHAWRSTAWPVICSKRDCKVCSQQKRCCFIKHMPPFSTQNFPLKCKCSVFVPVFQRLW